MSSNPRVRIIVPSRQIQGGFDFKFCSDSYDVPLKGILSADEYAEVVEAINEKIKPARSKKLDGALLAAGPLMLPLAVWGVRHSRQTRHRKKLLAEGIREFNESHPEHLMRWNRAPSSCLSIERRPVEAPTVSTNASANTQATVGTVELAEAKLVV